MQARSLRLEEAARHLGVTMRLVAEVADIPVALCRRGASPLSAAARALRDYPVAFVTRDDTDEPAGQTRTWLRGHHPVRREVV